MDGSFAPSSSSRHALTHVLYRPGPPLDRLVEFFWSTDEYSAQAPRERVLPTGAQVLVVNLGPDPMQVFAADRADHPALASSSVLCGARSSPLVIGTSSLGPSVGVHFKPGGARHFFDVPAEELAEQTVSLDTLWGPSVGSLRERLLEAPAQLERARLLEEFLVKRACRSYERSPALRLSLDAFEEPSLASLASVAEVNRRTGLSPKRLLALFRDEVGLSPKAFWRVRRFRAALRQLDLGTLRGAALASEHGYFDQAHFIREFRAFAGCSPREYLAARVGDSDHVSVYR